MIDPIFFRIFGAYFDVDVLESADPQKVKEHTRMCALELNHQVQHLQELNDDLSQLLQEWDSKVIYRFIEVTNIDWLANKELEDSLRCIVSEILDSLKNH